jgi:hypothetical protein
MLRALAVGLSFLGFVEGSFAGPPSALPTRKPSPTPPPTQVVPIANESPVVVQAPPVQQIAPVPVTPIAPAPVYHATPIPVQQAVPSPTPAIAHPCPCERTVRPGRAWLTGGRPVLIDDRFRYEPRIRDIRYSMPSSTLPGAGLGAPDTLFVLPPYQARDGYFRLFDTR